jgi:post-segregation antitoxin (ccd killing protein)
VSPDELDQLKRMAAKRQVNVSDLVRQAIAEVLNRKETAR